MTLRTFTLNSREFYEAVTPPPEPHRWGPGLPREPRIRDRPVIVEHRASSSPLPLRERVARHASRVRGR